MTERELQVAILVAEGLTDKQIGATLDIAEGTVGAHVAHAATALGVPKTGNTRVLITRAVMMLKDANGQYIWTNWHTRATLHAELVA